MHISLVPFYFLFLAHLSPALPWPIHTRVARPLIGQFDSRHMLSSLNSMCLLLLSSRSTSPCVTNVCRIVFRMMFLSHLPLHSLTSSSCYYFLELPLKKNWEIVVGFASERAARYRNAKRARRTATEKEWVIETKSVSFFRFRSRSISSASSSSCRNYCQLDKTPQTRRHQQSKTTTRSPASNESSEKDFGCKLLPSFQCIILTLDDDDDDDTEMVTMDSLQ